MRIGFKRSISYTTREPQFRDGKMEENGVEYIFVSRQVFNKLVQEDKIVGLTVKDINSNIETNIDEF